MQAAKGLTLSLAEDLVNQLIPLAIARGTDWQTMAIEHLRLIADGYMPVDRFLRIGDLLLDLVQKKAYFNSDLVKLGSTEFGLLTCLARHHGELVSKKELVVGISKERAALSTITVAIAALRTKLPSRAVIQNKRGRGYKLTVLDSRTPLL